MGRKSEKCKQNWRWSSNPSSGLSRVRHGMLPSNKPAWTRSAYPWHGKLNGSFALTTVSLALDLTIPVLWFHSYWFWFLRFISQSLWGTRRCGEGSEKGTGNVQGWRDRDHCCQIRTFSFKLTFPWSAKRQILPIHMSLDWLPVYTKSGSREPERRDTLILRVPTDTTNSSKMYCFCISSARLHIPHTSNQTKSRVESTHVVVQDVVIRPTNQTYDESMLLQFWNCAVVGQLEPWHGSEELRVWCGVVWTMGTDRAVESLLMLQGSVQVCMRPHGRSHTRAREIIQFCSHRDRDPPLLCMYTH